MAQVQDSEAPASERGDEGSSRFRKTSRGKLLLIIAGAALLLTVLAANVIGDALAQIAAAEAQFPFLRSSPELQLKKAEAYAAIIDIQAGTSEEMRCCNKSRSFISL